MLRNLIIAAGIILVLVGLFWPVISKIPLFRLPGDIVINKPGTKIYIPITSMIILSLLLTLLFKLFRH
jgi:hypothetical protein